MKMFIFPSPKHFEILYEGLVISKTRGAETRALGKVLTKLESVGSKRGETLLFTATDGAKVELEDAEYDLVKKLLNEVEWNGVGAKDAGALLDWIDLVPNQEALSHGILKKA